MGRSPGVYPRIGRKHEQDVYSLYHQHGIYLDAVLNAICGHVCEYSVTLTGSAGFEYISLDNVSVERVGGATIPEPTTYFLMAIGPLGSRRASTSEKAAQSQTRGLSPFSAYEGAATLTLRTRHPASCTSTAQESRRLRHHRPLRHE